jgi:hypothetical protein
MRRLRAFGAFWYDFVLGDDWRIAAWVVTGLAVTAAVAHWTSAAAWWVLPVMMLAGLAVSLRAAVRSADRAAVRSAEPREEGR